jgi:hypothetical protein
MNNELTQEQKQAIWAAGWLAMKAIPVFKAGMGLGWLIPNVSTFFSDAELIAYAQEKGMEIPAELQGKRLSLSDIARMPARTIFREVGYPLIAYTFMPYDKGYGPDDPPELHSQKVGEHRRTGGKWEQQFIAAEFELMTPEQINEWNEIHKKALEETK